MDADSFDRLSRISPYKVRDAGPSLDSEQMWFNQVPTAPIPGYKLQWFQSLNFRRAISAAINHEDLCKVVYDGHARPGPRPGLAGQQVLVDEAASGPLRYAALCNAPSP